MRPVRVLLAACALAGLAGCLGGTFDDCLATPPLPPPEPAPRVGFVGQPVDVQVLASQPFTCGEQPPQNPDALTSEVYAPDNHLVPSTARLEGPLSGTIRFTPDVPGRYHVVGAFAPVGGLSQVGVLAAVDRRTDSPRLLMPRACGEVRRTARGTWLCDETVVRDNKPAERLGELSGTVSPQLAVAGDVVWTASASGVRRYTDTGEAFTLTGQVAYSGGSNPPDFVLATEGELVTLHPTFLRRFTFSGGVLALVGETSLVGGSAQGGALVRAGDVLAVVYTQPMLGALRTRMCTFRLDAERYVRTAEDCQGLQGTLVGLEDGVMWTMETGNVDVSALPTHAVQRLVLTPGGRFEPQGLLELHGLVPQMASPLLGPALPLFMNQRTSPAMSLVVAWRPAQRDLVLEAMDSGQLANPRASPDLYWGLTGGTVGVRVRASPP